MAATEVTKGTVHQIFLRDATTRRDDLYGKAVIIDSTGSTVDEVNLESIGSDGLYRGEYTFSSIGEYAIVADLFFNVDRDIPTGHDGGGETVRVTEIETNIMRILGLNHENAYMDQQVFTNGHLVSARLRVYDSKTNAQLGGATGVIFTYTIQASYVNGEPTSFKILRDL